MRCRFAHIGIILLCFLPFWGQAQWGNYTRYTVDDGLPTNYVYGVIEDQDGEIWAYTEEGIARFNGKTFEVLNSENGLPVNDIFLLREDSLGRLFPGCFSCPAFYIEDGQAVVPDSANPVRNKIIPQGAEKGEVYLYAGDAFVKDSLYTADIYYYRPETGWRTQEARLVGYSYDMRRVGAFNWRMLIRFANDSLHVFLPKDTLTLPWSFGLPTRPYFRDTRLVYEPRSGTCLLDFENGYIGVDLQRKKTTILSPEELGLADADLVTLRVDYRGHYFLFHSAGYVELNDAFAVVDFFRPRESEVVFAGPYIDRAGNLWMGSKNAGLFFYRAMDRSVLSHVPVGMGNHTFRFFRKSKDGQVLAISDRGEVWTIDMENRIAELRDDLQHEGRLRFCNQMHWDNRTGWMIGLQEGTLFYSDTDSYVDRSLVNRLSTITFSMLANSVNHIYQNGVSLISLRAGPEYYYWSEQRSQRTEPNHRPLDLALDSTNQVCAVYSDGIYRMPFGEHSFERIVERSFIGDIGLSVSPENQLWLSDNTGGLFYMEGDSLRQLPGVDHFARGMYWENEQTLWLATNEGVMSIQSEPESDSAFTIQRYTTAHGLRSLDVTAVYVDAQHIYVGHDRGFDVLDRQVWEKGAELQPELRVNTAYFGPGKKPLSESVSIPYETNSVFIFAELRSYESKGNFHFEYRLSDEEAEWIRNESGIIQLQNLSPGKYQFQLRGVDAFGNYSEVFSRHFVVAKVWYLQIWFLILLSMGIITLGVLVALLWSRRTAQRVAREKEVESNMSRLKLQALRSQMNPHFVFNALGSIQYYIQKQEVEKADEYLSDFAALVRLILDSSQSDMVSFRDELKLLQYYVGLEHIRFEKHFTYEIRTDPEIDTDFKLPSMLIQPFVENAINHGLYHLQGHEGKLLLDFQAEDDNTLLVVIEDNGIGRTAAKKLRKKGHKPRGMQLIDEQLESLRKLKHLVTQVQVVDLFDKKQPAGTRVLIKMSYI